MALGVEESGVVLSRETSTRTVEIIM